MPNKRLPGLQKFSNIGFTYPQQSAPVGITKGPSVRRNKMLLISQPSHMTKKKNACVTVICLALPAFLPFSFYVLRWQSAYQSLIVIVLLSLLIYFIRT